MNRVLFTHSYFYKLDSKQWKFKQPYPPLGSLLAAAVIREAGFDVRYFDVALRDSATEIESELINYKPDYLVIYDDGFNYLTKMCLTVMREAALTMAGIAKENDITVVVCGSDSSDQYEKYLSNGVDYVVRGEGEDTLRELLIALNKKENCKEIKGLAFRSVNETAVTSQRAVMRELDALPLPAWDLIDIEPYRKIWKDHHGYFSLNVATTRGCPFKCNWCAKPIYGNRYNSRSPEHAVNEIEFLLKRFRPDHFWMCDDIFGLKPGWVKRFSELVKERSLKFKYKIQSRVDLLLEENTIEALAQSGIETVWVGAESGSQKILDAMDKGTTVNQIKEATRLLHEYKIKVAFFLQFGYSGETQQDIDATVKMVLDLMPDEIGISVSYPLPGTKFYENVKSQLNEKQNWSDSDDLAMMYQATFSPAYYKLLHRYVHSRYRIKRGWEQLKKKNFKVRALASMIYHAPISVVQGWKLNQLQNAPIEMIDNSIQVNEAFSRQSSHFDADDLQNPLLHDMRVQVYNHVSKFLTQPSNILELNSGTGIDALYFVQQGHKVFATDLSDGMIEQIRMKINYFQLQDRLSVNQLSYDQLDLIKDRRFDLVFSNFGGLNCIDDLARVTKNLPSILKVGGFVSWVLMPPVCLWEIFGILKGNRNAFRRFNKNGVVAHLEGKHFKVWYHSLSAIKKSFGPDFKLIQSEGLAALTPPPHVIKFSIKHPSAYNMLKMLDAGVRNNFPFNRWADHIIVTFQYAPRGNGFSR